MQRTIIDSVIFRQDFRFFLILKWGHLSDKWEIEAKDQAISADATSATLMIREEIVLQDNVFTPLHMHILSYYHYFALKISQ